MIEPRKYRKQPVVIEAVQLTRANASEVMAWCGGRPWSQPPMRAVTGLTIPTPEGDMAAPFGHWVIKGVAGEFYPCEPAIFETTYRDAEAMTDYQRGYIAAMQDYAVWKNGERFIGALERPLQVAINEFLQGNTPLNKGLDKLAGREQ